MKNLSSILIKAGVVVGLSCFILIFYVIWSYVAMQKVSTSANEVIHGDEVAVEPEVVEEVEEVQEPTQFVIFDDEVFGIGEDVILDEQNDKDFKDFHSLIYWNDEFSDKILNSKSFKIRLTDKVYKCKIIAINEGTSDDLICSIYQSGMYGFSSFVEMFLLGDSQMKTSYKYNYGDRIVSLVSDKSKLVISGVIKDEVKHKK